MHSRRNWLAGRTSDSVGGHLGSHRAVLRFRIVASGCRRRALPGSFFEIQADFARKVAGILAVPEHEAFRNRTTFHWVASDKDAGLPSERWSFDAGHPAWQAFVNAIGTSVDPVDYVH